MRKWPKKMANEVNDAVRSRLLPRFLHHGFVEFPIGGGGGQYWGGSYDTDLFRSNGTKVDLINIAVNADGFHPLSVSIHAVRASGQVDVHRRLPSTSSFPLDSQYALMPRLNWRNLLHPVFKVGPPWPVDRHDGIQRLIDEMAGRLPVLFEFLERGQVRYLFGQRIYPRLPFPPDYQ